MILLKNCRFIITQNKKRETLQNKNILIEDNRISSFEQDKSDEIIDCSNKIVLPGLINTHTHAAMSLMRGFADDMPLNAWLKEKIWPLETKLNEDYVYYGMLLAAIEMIKSGTICFNDMYFFGKGVKRAVEEIGVRCFFSQSVLDFPTAEFKNQQEAFKIFKKLLNEKSELFIPTIGTHSIYACSKETLMKAMEFSEKYDSQIHIHLSEIEKEVEDCIKQNNLRPVEYMNDIGFLNRDIIAAHCVWLSPNEIILLKENNVKVSHCPASNLKLTAGIAPIVNFLSSKINVSLGTDSAVSNNNLNLFEEMKFASLLHKINNKDATVLNAQQALDMATLNAAKALGLQSGSIEIGKNADLILTDIENVTIRPFHNIVSNLIYSFNGHVSDVIINGNIIMRNNAIKTIDEQNVLDKIEQKARDLVS